MFPPDAPLPKEAGEESFVSHQVVLQYLEDYAKNVRHLIKFNSKVQKVERRGNKWMIRTKTEDDVKESFFDIVFVCNGHYFKPSYPALKNQFKRKTLHSHNYRRPQEFTGETVAIVGAGFSGTDIALQLAENAKKVYMLHRKAPQFTDLPSNIIECQALKDITPDGESLLLQDNSTLDDVETVIFCTGYDYEFPFFCEDVIRVTENGKVVSPLCLHMLHTTYSNSLFFIGLPFYSLPFLLADYQVKFALSVVKGTAEVSEEKLQNYEVERMLHVLEKYGSKAKFHQIGSEMFDLLREYARRGRFEDIIDYSKAQKMSTHLGKQREANLVGYKTEPYSLFE